MPKCEYLFVYGTLRAAAGTEWSKFLQSQSDFVDGGRTPGLLFQLDGYPGMTVREDHDAWVRGEVYLLHDPAATLPRLDAYEGCEFERQVVSVTLDHGRTISAWAYIYCGNLG
jgi:gamma-glutamylcyclotransferase (GGCT)/AIG2-like uncharacterized protein YtfP